MIDDKIDPPRRILQNKQYDPLSEEPNRFREWQEKKIYAFDKGTKKPVFTIDTPPPYTNAAWHLGSAIHYATIDMIARTMRMKGYEVLFPMGLDRNGLPIEIQAEKHYHIRAKDVGRERFLQLCKDLLDQIGDQILEIAKILGLSCNSFDWDEVYKTDEQKYRALTQATFLDHWNKGLIYEDDRPSNWDPKLQTTIADAEIEYEDGVHTLYDIEFEVDSGEKLLISTGRPELLPAIGIIIFHPDDIRYRHLEGRLATTPLWKIKIPIKSHLSADPGFGQGILMVCSFGDINDINLYRELKLSPKYILSQDGRMNSNAGEKYAGLKIDEARSQIIADLESMGKISGQRKIAYKFPISERSKAKIEFIGTPELYLKQKRYVHTLEEYAKRMTFLPDEARQIWMDWLAGVDMDWPISRRRYYGTEVPLWYCKGCKKAIVPPAGPYYQPWRFSPPLETCPTCHGKEFEGDTRILDTWMDSSISALYIIRYPHNRQSGTELEARSLERNFFCDIRPQGKEIVRTWLHYSMLRGEILFGRPMFKTAWISGHVVTESGEKMSKSKGNVIDPAKILKKYGADALRLFGASEATHGSDIRFSETKLAGISKFLNKLYNIARFVSFFDYPASFDIKGLEREDKDILKKLGQSGMEATKGYEIFDFHIPARTLRRFTWDDLASDYLEKVKARAYNSEKYYPSLASDAAKWTMYTCLRMILLFSSPIIPFLTDSLFQALFGKSIHLEKFPTLEELMTWTKE